MSAIQYQPPDHWIKYDKESVFLELADAKGAVLSPKGYPFSKKMG